MRAKFDKQAQAIKLRQSGHSYNEISKEIGVAKSSVSLWCRSVVLSPIAKKIVAAKRADALKRSSNTKRAVTQKRLEEAKQYAQSDLKTFAIDRQKARILCSLLYWCEGEKGLNDMTIAFTNSDPCVIATFLYLFRKGFAINENKLRALVHLHEYHNERKQLQFWSQVTKIPEAQFSRPYRKPHTGVRQRKGYAGCISIRYSEVYIARQVIALGRLFMQKFGPIG